MWTIEMLDSSLQPAQSISLPPGTHAVGRELLGLVDKWISRKQLQLTLPTEGRVSMLKVTGANPSILQSAVGAGQVLTKSTPAVRVGSADVIWLGRVHGSSELKHPIRVVAPSPAPDALHLMDLPEELLCLTLRNAITRSPWPGGWAVFRLVSRRGWAVFLEVAVYERGGGGGREKLLWRLQKATWAFFLLAVVGGEGALPPCQNLARRWAIRRPGWVRASAMGHLSTAMGQTPRSHLYSPTMSLALRTTKLVARRWARHLGRLTLKLL